MGWLNFIIALLGSSVVYLLVDKLFSRRKDKADAKATQIANASEAAKLYQEIDEIVQQKTAPLEEKLDRALFELDNIRAHWCCYREDCDDRILIPENNENKETKRR